MRGYSPEKRKSGSREDTLPQRGRESLRGKIAAWLALLKASWQSVLSVDRSSITAFQAIRSAFGVGLPLVLGVVTDQISAGALIASGALMLGSIGLKDPYRTRVWAMSLACLFVTLSTLIGGLIGGFGWLPVLVIGLWGLGAGMFASLSNVAQIIGIQSCVALIVYAHLGLDPPHAVLTAGLVCLGALFQILLARLPSPWKNTVPERATLATIYRKLADYAEQPSSEPGALQMSDALLAGHTVLLNSDTKSAQGQMFARLLEEAEHLRLTLSLLVSQRQYLRELQGTEEVGAALEQILRASSAELRAIAQALRPSIFADKSAEIDEGSSEAIKRALTDLRRAAQGAEANRAARLILPHCQALLGEMRIARRLATSWQRAHQYWPARIRFPYPRPPHLHLDNAWANLRANLTPRSSTFRHAARLGVTLALCTALYQIFRLPIERGYWIPMTAALVLRSDFITTFTRGSARLLGTLLGAVLTTLLVILLAPSSSLLLLVVILAAYLMYATLLANYTVFSMATTMAVVFLLAFIRAPTLTTAADRALDTAIGGVLALLIYLLWPTWEQARVLANAANRLEKLACYLTLVMQAYADPGAPPIGAFDKRHLDSRLARSNALGSVQRALQEPGTRQAAAAELAANILAAADNLARAVLALEAYLYDHPRHDTLPEVAEFSKALNQALTQIAAALRAEQPGTELPDLSTTLHRLKSAVKARAQTKADPATREQWLFVIEQARHMVKYVQAMQQLLTAYSTP